MKNGSKRTMRARRRGPKSVTLANSSYQVE